MKDFYKKSKEIQPLYNVKGKDIVEIYRALEVTSDNGCYSNHLLLNILMDKIRKNFLNHNNEDYFHKLISIKNCLIFDRVIYKNDKKICEKIISIFIDTLNSDRNKIVDLSIFDEIMNENIAIAKTIIDLNFYQINDDHISMDLKSKLESARFLIDAGFKVENRNDDFYLSEKSQKLFLANIKRLIIDVTPSFFLKKLFEISIIERYRKSIDKFDFRYTVNIMDTTYRKIVPFNFLVNMATQVAQFTFKSKNLSEHEKTRRYNKIIELSSNFLHLHSGVSESWISILNMSPYYILRFIKSSLFYDNMVVFRHFSVDYGVAFIESIFDNENINVLIKETDIDKNLIFKICNFIRLKETSIGPSFFSISELNFIPQNMLEFFILNIKDYENILGFFPNKISYKPFIKISKNEIIILDKRISIFSMFYAVKGLISSRSISSRKIGEAIGHAGERFLQEILSDLHRNDLYFGEFKRKNLPVFEVDSMLKIDNKLIIFEIKKEELSFNAIAGDLVKMIQHFDKAFVSPHKQITNIYKNLLENHMKTINISNKQFILEKEEIHPIVVSLIEFEGFSDSLLSTKILEVFIRSSFGVNNGMGVNTMNDINKSLEILKNNLIKIEEIEVKLNRVDPKNLNYVEIYLHHSNFCSLEYIYILSKLEKHNFLKALTNNSIIGGYKDNFSEYLNRKKLDIT